MKPGSSSNGLCVLAALLALAGAPACGGDDKKPAPAPPSPPPALPEIIEKIHPALHLDSPMRGTFADGPITVSGGTAPGSAPILSLTVAGVQVPIGADGRFEHTLAVEPGPNIVEVRLVAEDQGRAVDAFTVFGGPLYAPGETIDDAIVIHLGRSFLDDNNPDLDDIATITEVMLMDQAFLTGFLGAPFEVEGQTLTVSTISYSFAAVDLSPITDCLSGRVVLGDVDPLVGGLFHLEMGVSGAASIFGDIVRVEASSATVGMQLCPVRGGSGELLFEVREPAVAFADFVASTNDLPNFGETFPSVNETLKALIEEQMAAWISENFGGALAGFLEAFELDYTLAGLRTVVNLEDVAVTTDGVDMALSASFQSPVGLRSPPLGAGSLRTDDVPLPFGFSDAPIALALSDDAINQLLFAVWYSGRLGEYELPPEATESLPEVFQPLSELEVELRLPPTLLAPTEPEFRYDIGAGGVRLQILAGSDRRFDSAVHVRAGVRLSVAADGALSMTLDDRAQRITVRANVAAAPTVLDPGDVAALFRMMVPAVLGQANVSYAGYPIPDLELSSFSERVAALQGRRLRFVPEASSKAGGGGGYFVLEGALVEP